MTNELLVLYPTARLAEIMLWAILMTAVFTFGLMASAKTWTRLIAYAVLTPSLGLALIRHEPRLCVDGYGGVRYVFTAPAAL